MKTIAFFNNKGGVGKTSLVYHLAWMLAELDVSVLVADLDPQCNLTSAFLSEEELETIWPVEGRHPRTIFGAIENRARGKGDVEPPEPWMIRPNLALIPGDLALSRFEDELSRTWVACGAENLTAEGAFLSMRSLWRTIRLVGDQLGSRVALIDVGPNIGALNRAALISADHVVVPLAGDLFSLQGLANLGPTLTEWRTRWSEHLQRPAAREVGLLPSGDMHPLGYVVLNPSVRENYPVKAYRKWTGRIPRYYADHVLRRGSSCEDPANDNECLAMIKHFKSLMPMSQEARKPMFLLKAKDGAIGGHAGAVRDCYEQFQNLAMKILMLSRA